MLNPEIILALEDVIKAYMTDGNVLLEKIRTLKPNIGGELQ
jgi:hypothetical protein